MFHLSGAQVVVLLALSVVWAVLGYRLSENDRKRLGRTPWGLPSAVWALFWFLSLIVGLVLYLIAHSGAVRRAQQMPPTGGSPLTGPSGVSGFSSAKAPTIAEQFPAYPQPANSRPADTGAGADSGVGAGAVGDADHQADQDVAVPGAPTDAESSVDPMDPAEVTQHWPHSPPAWHPDPSGRFHYRWWDGSEWTSQVSTDGHHLIDTNPDQRIGPY